MTRRPQGVARALYDLLLAGRYQVVMSEATLMELGETLQTPTLVARHGLSVDDVLALVEETRAIAVMVPGTRSVSIPALEARDPDDVALVVAAVEGEARYLVSQDLDLLDLKRFENVDMIEPLAFLQRLRSQELDQS